MGSSLSIEKHTSNIDDILKINSKIYHQIEMNDSVPETIGFHLRVQFSPGFQILIIPKTNYLTPTLDVEVH